MFDFADGGGGGFFSRQTRKTRKTKNQSKGKTLPALAFVFPYHELLLRGLLDVGGLQIKTRKSRWNYREPVLLYTSHGRLHLVPTKVYNLNSDNFSKGSIVGVATMVDSRELTWQEKIKVTQNFNRVNAETAEEMLFGTDGDYVTPYPIGVFLKNVKRFKNPIPFKPRPGAVGIMRVPIAKVRKALKEIGIDSKNI